MVDVPAMVSAPWLSSHLNDEDIRIIDASWPILDTASDSEYQEYLKDHIPGAGYLPINKCLKFTSRIVMDVQDIDVFSAEARCHGINSDTHVILYDQNAFNLPYSSARTWWIFRLFGHTKVSVLSGGMPAWKKGGYETTTELPNFKTGNFNGNFNRKLLITFEEMSENIKNGNKQIVDMREPNDFDGSQPEPCSVTKMAANAAHVEVPSGELQKGHMIGAKGIPFPTLSDENTLQLKNTDDMKTLFKSRGVDISRPIVSTCYIGMTACTFALAAALCGNTDVAVYHGSWFEFCQRAGPEACETGPLKST